MGVGIKDYYGNDIKLKPNVAAQFKNVAEALKSKGIDIKIADNYVPKEVKKAAYERWIAGGKKGPQQAGEKSFHSHGQAIDLVQSHAMKNEKVFAELRKAGFKQHPNEWWHWSIGEFTG